MEDKYDELLRFLSAGECPPGYDKSQRFSFKQNAAKFTLTDGEIFIGCKKVIRTKEEAKRIFREFHASELGGHAGVTRTRSSICSRFFWRGMTTDIDNWVLECDQCRLRRPSTASLPPIKVSAPWDLVVMDVVGPLPETAGGFQYVLCATDFLSKWVEAYPLRSKSPEEVVRAMLELVYRYGCPKQILSDRSSEFANDLNFNFCSLMGIERSLTSTHQQQSHGADEKTNDNLKRYIKKLVKERKSSWDRYLGPMLFALRSKPHTTTKMSPFYLLYGREARFPSQVPAELPLTNIILPEESDYVRYMEERRATAAIANRLAMENIARAQERHKRSKAKRDKKGEEQGDSAPDMEQTWGEIVTEIEKSVTELEENMEEEEP